MIIPYLNNNINFTARMCYPLVPKKELEMYLNKGYTYSQIADIYGVSVGAVDRSMRTYNMLNPRTKERLAESESIRRLHEEGLSIVEIRKLLGFSRKRIYQALRKNPEEETLLEKTIKKLNLSKEDVKKYLK